MKPNLVLGALLLTLGIFFSRARSPYRQRLVLLLSLAPALISVLTLSQYLFTFSIGIDEFFMPDPAGDGPFLFPGRMSIAAAISLCFLSVALCLSPYRRFALASQLFAASSLIFCYFNLVANLFGVSKLYGAALFFSMSLAASVFGFLMSLAMLSLRPRLGFMSNISAKSPGGEIALRLLPAIFIVPTVGGYLRLHGELMGLYDSRFGLTLFTNFNIAVFSVLVLFCAASVNRFDRYRSTVQSRLDLSRHRYRAVIDALPQLAWTCIPSGECDFLNEHWLAYTGAPEATQLGYGWLGFVHPDDLNSIQAHWQTAFSTGTPLDAEYRILGADGLYRWFSARATPLRRPDGEIEKWFGSSSDIDQLKRAQNEIQTWNQTLEQRVSLRTLEVSDALNRLQAVLDAATQVSIIATNADGLIEVFNAGAEAMLGYSAYELVGKSTPATLHDPLDAQARAAELSALHGRPVSGFEIFTLYPSQGIPETREWVYIHKDGHKIEVQLAVAARRSTSGEINGFVGIAIDVSERNALQRRLLEQNLSLEIANLEAQAASKAKGNFLANMSHEIRTPMNGIIGMTGLLLDTGLTREQSVFVEAVRASGEALLSLINDILDFSKIESGKLDLEVIEFQLHPMLDATLQLLAPKADDKGLELTCQIDASLSDSVGGDPGRIRQVLLNLAGNAIKFTSSGDVKIEVHPDPEVHGHTRFSVTDTGIGIPSDRMNLLFAAFSQVDSSTSRLFGGTGLGLAISKQLVLLMGGEIGVSSQLGSGSTFWFRLPLKSIPQTPLASGPLQDFSLAGFRILIVDDSETSRLLIGNLLLSWGCLFASKSDPFEALQLLRSSALSGTPFDIAVIDFRMPQLSGDKLARMILEDPLCAGVRLFLMTSVTVRGHAQLSQEAGFSAYLTKPLRQNDLREVLQLVLQNRTSSTSLQSSPLPLITQHTLAEVRQQRGRILLAEDNTTNQMVAVEILKKLGYWVEVVANGAEALDALRAAPYNLVLMDCQMPEMDGYTATALIRAGGNGIPDPQIPVIAMTAFAMQGDRDRCIAAGMNDYIAKPIRSKDLAATVERWLETASSSKFASIPIPPKTDQECKI